MSPRLVTLARRLLLFLGATVFALLLSEVLFRFLGPGPPGEARIFLADGEQVPLGEIFRHLSANAGRNGDQPGPRGWLAPGSRFHVGYTRPRWDYFDENGCVEVVIDSLGFRDDEFTVQKSPGEFRAIALGDSFTFGLGVPGDLAWPQVLEGLLRPGRPAPVQVINAGFACNAHSPAGYCEWMAKEGLGFAPDLVIVGFCLNDIGFVPMLSYKVVAKEPILGGYSRLLDHVVWMVRQRRVRNQPRDDMLQHIELARQFGPWLESQRGLRELKALLDEHGVPLVVAVFPMLTQLDRYPYARLHDIVVEFCEAAGIRHVDLQRPFLGLTDEDLWVHPTDQHPNHVGHRMLAQGIHAFLRQSGLDGSRK